MTGGKEAREKKKRSPGATKEVNGRQKVLRESRLGLKS